MIIHCHHAKETFTLQVSVTTLPFASVTVHVTVAEPEPRFTAVTLPFPSTLTTDVPMRYLSNCINY